MIFEAPGQPKSMRNQLKTDLTMRFRMECLNCVPFLSKIFPKTLPRRPETAQDDPRDAPREPKTSPRHPQDARKKRPRGAPEASLGGPGGIRERPEARSRSGAARDRQNTTKRSPKCRQNDSRKFKKLPKKNFKMIQESSPEHLPKWSSEASNEPRLGNLYHRFMG